MNKNLTDGPSHRIKGFVKHFENKTTWTVLYANIKTQSVHIVACCICSK